MSIHPSGQCDYSVVVLRSPDGAWLGRADPTPAGAFHPGIVGSEPRVEVAGGVLRLQRTASLLSLPDRLLRHPGRTIDRVGIPVGRLEDVLNDGDRLRVSRGGTGDVTVMVDRADTPILGLGAVTGPFTSTIHIENDPRVYETHLYSVKHDLADPRVTFLWLHVADPELDRLVEEVPDMAPGGRMIIAIAGPSREERVRLNQRLGDSRSTASSTRYIDVDSRFTTEARWRDYVAGLPDTRPDDLFVRFTIDGVSVDLLERQYQEHPRWQLYVQKVFRLGIPGEWSHVAIVQRSLGMSRAAIVEATAQIASGRIQMTP